MRQSFGVHPDSHGVTGVTSTTCVLVNAKAARQRTDAIEQDLRSAFARHGRTVEIRIVRRGSHLQSAAASAVRDGFQVVVAAGGDGTLNAIASALVKTSCVLGVLPLGTFNYFARDLGIPMILEAAVETLLTGSLRPVNVGEVNGRIFLNNASLGTYAGILETRERVYSRWGRSQLAAYWSVLLTLLHPFSPLDTTIHVGTRTMPRRTPFLFFVTNAFQLRQFGLPGTECIGSDRLACYVGPDASRFALIRQATGLLLGRLRSSRDFELLCENDVLVSTRRRRCIVVRDGEREVMHGPYRFRLHRQALHVLVPSARLL